MCNAISLHSSREDIENRFNARIKPTEKFEPFYYRSGFLQSNIYIVPQGSPKNIAQAHWGLVPEFAVNNIKSFRRRYKELTAKSEDIFSSIVYSDSAKYKRCLVLADGFFEAHYRNDIAYPFYCHLSNNSPFAFAGLYSEIARDTFSCCILTTAANTFFSRLHNLRKRMPIILDHSLETEWLAENNSVEQITKIITSASAIDGIEVHPVSQKLYQHGVKKNAPFAVLKTTHPDLEQNGSYFT